MLVCWDWLERYVALEVAPEELADRFAMSGLNHEGTQRVGQDVVLDLEVTSNRGDCLGHIGVAREAAVLLDQAMCLPDPRPACDGNSAADSIRVDNQFTDACPEYTARVVRGVRIGPSPEWLRRRLQAVGIKSVNNVVDVTNYVMMECGQPLHAFDYAHLQGKQIIVRPARAGEKFVAIDHQTYELDDRMVVIADAGRAIALGGVMGGVDSEVSEATRDVLVEAALFAPLAIRRAAHRLKLHSPSSYRFERRPDPAGLDWASRRCCQLILEVAGGTLEQGMVASGETPAPRSPIPFRLARIPIVLGIEVERPEVERILTALGCQVASKPADALQVTPPTWRGDLTRECDLIEEVARIHGYEKIPEDVAVPLAVAAPRRKDLAMQRIRHVLSAYGVDEAMTPSVVTDQLESCGSPWSDRPPLTTEVPLLVGSKNLRRSLLPSLLACRYTNQTQAIRDAQLYEVAAVYLPSDDEHGLPTERICLGIVTTGELRVTKGIVEAILEEVTAKRTNWQWRQVDHPLFQPGSGLEIMLDGTRLGALGLVNQTVRNRLSLDHPCGAAELDLDLLTDALQDVRTADPVSPFPAVHRDLNFIVEESLRWSELAEVCRQHGGELLREVSYQETYRDPKKDGGGKKRMLLTLHFQSLQRTLTSQQVDELVEKIVLECLSRFQAQLVA